MFNMIELGDLCDLQNGFAFKSKDYIKESNTLNFRMSNIKPDGRVDINYNPKYLPDDYAMKYSRYILKDNDVVIAMTDMASDPKILGVPSVIKTNGKTLLLNQRVGKLVIKEKEKIFIPYLQYALNRQQVKNYFKSFAGGGLQLNIGKEDILKVQIPLPPLQTQNKIVEVLDKAQALIDARKEQIRLLDDLIQSTFHDMFGNPVTNPKGWDEKSLTEFTLRDQYSIKRGPFGGSLKKEIFVKAGFLVYEQYHAINDDFSMARYFIDKNKYEELKAFKVAPGDLIISCSGVTLGRIAEIPHNGREGIINQALLKLSLDQNIMNNTYFKYQFRQERIQDILFGFSHGSGIPNFPPMSTIKSITFTVPPIHLQNQFAEIVQKIESQKQLMQKSLEEMELGYNSLMQRAFKGELFA